jgi:hypothetical protein
MDQAAAAAALPVTLAIRGLLEAMAAPMAGAAAAARRVRTPPVLPAAARKASSVFGTNREELSDMSDYAMLAQYPKQMVVRDRNLGGLVAWAAYTTAETIPTTKPAEDWVRLRIVGEQIPLNTTTYVDRTIHYFLQDPATIANARAYMSLYNDDAQEATLSDEIQTVIGAFMPRFAASDVSEAQVQQWYTDHGFPTTP